MQMGEFGGKRTGAVGAAVDPLINAETVHVRYWAELFRFGD
jgi:hypothetical protein